MSAENSMAKRIKNALKSLMTDMTYDAGSGASAAFANVIGSTHQEFDGYPVCRILPDQLDNEVVSNMENDRTLNFILRVTVPVATDTADVKFDYLYDITEKMLDTLDEEDRHNRLHTIDPSLSIVKINSTRGSWLTAETDNGIMLLFDVNVAVTYSKDLS